MQKSKFTDYQQERRMAWLGGIMDGEGSFSITHKSGWGSQRGKTFYYPDISIVNTNPLVIDQCAEIITPICGYHIEQKKPDKYRKLIIWRIRILGFKRCANFLPRIIPYLVGKKEEASAVLRFVQTTGENDLKLREQMKIDLIAIRNPQRLYAQPFKKLKVMI